MKSILVKRGILISFLFITLLFIAMAINGLINLDNRYGANIKIELGLDKETDWVEKRFKTYGSEPYILWANTTFKDKIGGPYITVYSGLFEIQIQDDDSMIIFEKKYINSRLNSGGIDELVRREFSFRSIYPVERVFRIRIVDNDSKFTNTITSFNFERVDKGLFAVGAGIFWFVILFIASIAIIIEFIFSLKLFRTINKVL
ncbi:MAG: hypothetical protein ACI8PT_000198 [Gammaproteobacteria bacterium]|jgi:hypothetical protein